MAYIAVGFLLGSFCCWICVKAAVACNGKKWRDELEKFLEDLKVRDDDTAVYINGYYIKDEYLLHRLKELSESFGLLIKRYHVSLPTDAQDPFSPPPV